MSERRLMAPSDVLALPEPYWLADFIIPQRSLSMLWGPPNVGKSFVTLDLACSIALGDSWLGRDTTQGTVVYVAGEGVQSFKRRLQAWLRYNHLAEGDLDGELFFRPTPLKLQEGVSAFIRDVEPLDPSLIVVDTLGASSLGVAENANDGIGPVLESLLKLRKELKAAVLAVHHTGWEESHERGASAIRATVDTSIEMTGRRIKQGKYDDAWKNDPSDKRRTLVTRKQRDAERAYDISINLQEIRWKTKFGERNSLVPVLR